MSRISTWFLVECVRCGLRWNEDDPEHEVCGCFDTHGTRTVRIISAGATNGWVRA